MNPKVSIIMATYNRAHFIVETLLSIQNQVFKEWECLIVDDGGTDNTIEVIKSILESDTRFKFFTRDERYKKGLPGCRNYGLDLAEGDYIIFFDDDDIVHPQNLELCVKELIQKEIFFCRYVRKVFFDTFDYNFDYSKSYTSFLIDDNDIEKIVKNELPFNSCAVMWKKECFENNRFIETLMYAEEWELYSRIISSGHKGISIEKDLFYGRKHDNSNTSEFYNSNPIRRESYVEAVLLVVQNLEAQKKLSYSLKRYFIASSISFKEYHLFRRIVNVLNVSISEKVMWIFFYNTLPLRLKIYKRRKLIKNKYNL